MKKFRIKDFINEFKFKPLYFPSNISIDDHLQLKIDGINRAGLELVGFTSTERVRRVAYLGSKEAMYLASLTSSLRDKAIINLLMQNLPFLIVNQKFIYSDLLCKLAKSIHCSFFILQSKLPTSNMFAKVGLFIEEHVAPIKEFHASLMEIYGVGILILGGSGVGKSELCLDLITKGHSFVADDRAIVNYYGGKLIGKCHPVLKEFLEIRGLGVLNLREIIGSASILNSVELFGAVELVTKDYQSEHSLLRGSSPFNNIFSLDVLGHSIYCMKIPVLLGRNLALLTQWAVKFMKDYDYSSKHAHKKINSNVEDVIDQRISQFLETIDASSDLKEDYCVNEDDCDEDDCDEDDCDENNSESGNDE